eukprot:TRINITY_DN2247_c0_g1_i2.p1 TRINITY_DN2247_c0_g1~~TRINITY_DN2247_c0_g1_i2.p1  ORF type:complete len:276 (-),score=37.59 TRINITY_DN2247_c0_g1_i2:540-1367(-)
MEYEDSYQSLSFSAFMITEDGCLISWGHNNCGQTFSQSEDPMLLGEEDLNTKSRVRLLSAGFTITCIVFEDDTVQLSGLNREINFSVFSKNNPVQVVSCQGTNILFLTKSGNVYKLDNNESSKLIPCLNFSTLGRVVDIFSGRSYSLFKILKNDNDHEYYSMGCHFMDERNEKYAVNDICCLELCKRFGQDIKVWAMAEWIFLKQISTKKVFSAGVPQYISREETNTNLLMEIETSDKLQMGEEFISFSGGARHSIGLTNLGFAYSVGGLNFYLI